jgi:signal transduction histidine kinase
MGRLFWKFFFFFWLAQLVTSMGVGTAIWLTRPEPGLGPGAIHDLRPLPPPGEFDRKDRPPPPPPHPDGRPPHKSFLRSPLLPLTAGSVVSLLFAALLAWYFAKPIRSLRQAFESVAGGRLKTRVGGAMGRRKDELADLGSDFDHMADRLQGLIDSQRRLLHDISHEVRSPLARLQAAADLIRQQPERAAELSERIERDTKRIDVLVGELLTLSRLEAGVMDSTHEQIDMGNLTADVVHDALIEAEANGRAVDLLVHDAVFVSGSHELLHRAVENVVRNAIRHTPEGSNVSVVIRKDKEGRYMNLSILDQGPGVPENELGAIFEPFFRGDGIKNLDGHGLGLAIARHVAEAHGGNISASNRECGGLCVEIKLPLIQSDAGYVENLL